MGIQAALYGTQIIKGRAFIPPAANNVIIRDGRIGTHSAIVATSQDPAFPVAVTAQIPGSFTLLVGAPPGGQGLIVEYAIHN